MRSVIGLHIDTSSVNAAQIAHNNKGQATLIKTAVEKISPKDAAQTDAEISSALTRVLSQFTLKPAGIICTFHDPQIFIRRITTPPMPSQELGQAVQLAVKNAFPFSLDEAVLDFQLVDKFSLQGKERFNVLVAVAPLKVIEHFQGLFSKAKIKLTACIPVAVALENLIARSRPKASETLAVIVLGPAVTELAIYHDSHLEFSRKLSMSAEDIIKSMTGSFFSDTGKTELTFSEAQAIEKEFGIPKPDEQVQFNEKISSQQVLMLIGPKIEQLATEIGRSIDYYREELQGGKVDRVLLVGETAQIKRLDEFLSAQLDLIVSCGDPLEGLGMNVEAQKQLLAIGAAFSGTQGINLLTKRSDKKNTFKNKTAVLQVIVIAVIVVISAAFIFLNDQFQSKSNQMLSKDQEFTARMTEAQDIHRLIQSRPSWGEILKSFSAMPPAIYLTELNLSSAQVLIKGDVLGEGKDPKKTLADFIVSLQENSLKDARLKSLKKANDEADKFEFEIVADVEAVK